MLGLFGYRTELSEGGKHALSIVRICRVVDDRICGRA